MNWYKESQQEIGYKEALSLEKWIIGFAKQMTHLFISFSNGEFIGEDGGLGDYKKYMERINPLIKVMKIYI